MFDQLKGISPNTKKRSGRVQFHPVMILFLLALVCKLLGTILLAAPFSLSPILLLHLLLESCDTVGDGRPIAAQLLAPLHL